MMVTMEDYDISNDFSLQRSWLIRSNPDMQLTDLITFSFLECKVVVNTVLLSIDITWVNNLKRYSADVFLYFD